MLLHEILQTHLLRALVANLKIGAIYALYPESFCDPNLAIRTVFAFSDSDRMYTIFMYNLWQPVLIYMSACCIISVRYRCTFPCTTFPLSLPVVLYFFLQGPFIIWIFNVRAFYYCTTEAKHNLSSAVTYPTIEPVNWIHTSLGYHKMKNLHLVITRWYFFRQF